MKKILGFFPYFENGIVGGVEISGKIAWQRVQREVEKGEAAACLVSYLNPSGGNIRSKWLAKIAPILKVLKCDQSFNTVLIWHVGLLKLLPFLRASQKKVILFLHGIEVWKNQDLFTKLLLSQVDIFLSNTHYTWQGFLQFNPRFIDTLHETVYLGTGAPVGSSFYFPCDPPPCVLMISRLDNQDSKGHREIIKAWPLVRKNISDAQLWIVGEGSLRADLENLVREYRLVSGVRFLGKVSELKKEELLSQCRCLAMPSRSEGFGIVYIEAMRFGKPCLVSVFDAGREIVNPPEAGLAVDPADTEKLVESICRLLTPGQEWEHWSKQARFRYESLFTEKQFQERLFKVLRSIKV